MLVVSNIAMRFPGENTWLFTDVSFRVNAGEAIAVVGPNGSGKSTLLQVVVGQRQPDFGSVTLARPDLQIGALSQASLSATGGTIATFMQPQLVALQAAEARLTQLAPLTTDDSTDAIDAFDTTLRQINDLALQVDEKAVRRALAEVGLKNVALDDPVQTLSGGQKTRLALARLILEQPDLLVLDEPTNHLDLPTIDWLAGWLSDYRGAVLFASHDRAFVDHLATALVVLDDDSNQVRTYTGSYTDYLETRRREAEDQWTQWQAQQVEIARLRGDVSRRMSMAIKREKATQNDFQRGRAKMVAQKAQALKRRLERYIDSEDRVEKPTPRWDVKLLFGQTAPIRGAVVRTQDLTIGYEPAAPLLTNLHLTVQDGQHIAITGPNGQGKSTLLKTLIGQIPALEGQIQWSSAAQIGYLSQEQETLEPTTTPLETIQRAARITETEARGFLHFFLFSGDDPLRPIHSLSYGERTRLMLAQLIAAGANVLVMDEPLNHLDLTSLEKFELAITQFKGPVLAVAHDRYFIEQFASHIWHIADGTLSITVR